MKAWLQSFELVLAKVGEAPGANDMAVLPSAPDGDEASAEHSADMHFGALPPACTAFSGRWLAPRHPALLVKDTAQKHGGDGR